MCIAFIHEASESKEVNLSELDQAIVQVGNLIREIILPF